MPDAQLDLFPELIPAPAGPPPPDPFTQRLVDLGLEHNPYLLEMNRTLGGWDTLEGGRWNLPSRAFRFPIEYFAPGRITEGGCLGLNHPELHAHPYVQRVAELLGEPIPWRAEDEYGRDRGAQWRYFHAIDLATDKLYPGLLETAEFTDAEEAAAGVSFGVRYGSLSPGHGRFVLLAFGHEEPVDRSAAALQAGIVKPDPIFLDDSGKPTKKPRYGMNEGLPRGAVDAADRAWAFIHGLEDDVFTIPRRKGAMSHITMTPAGLERLAHLIKPRDRQPLPDISPGAKPQNQRRTDR